MSEQLQDEEDRAAINQLKAAFWDYDRAQERQAGALQREVEARRARMHREASLGHTSQSSHPGFTLRFGTGSGGFSPFGFELGGPWGMPAMGMYHTPPFESGYRNRAWDAETASSSGDDKADKEPDAPMVPQRKSRAYRFPIFDSADDDFSQIIEFQTMDPYAPRGLTLPVTLLIEFPPSSPVAHGDDASRTDKITPTAETETKTETASWESKCAAKLLASSSQSSREETASAYDINCLAAKLTAAASMGLFKDLTDELESGGDGSGWLDALRESQLEKTRKVSERQSMKRRLGIADLSEDSTGGADGRARLKSSV